MMITAPQVVGALKRQRKISNGQTVDEAITHVDILLKAATKKIEARNKSTEAHDRIAFNELVEIWAAIDEEINSPKSNPKSFYANLRNLSDSDQEKRLLWHIGHRAWSLRERRTLSFELLLKENPLALFPPRFKK